MRVRTEWHGAMLVAFGVALACGGTDPGDEASGDLAAANATNRKGGARLTVGGTLSGLSGDAVTLQDNGSYDTLTLSANGTFTFAKPLKNRSTYAVTVLTQPSGQTCTVANGTGTISGASVTDVAVACSPNPSPVTYYTVGGKITGFTGTLVLLNNGGDAVTVSGRCVDVGYFQFQTPLADGASYAVTVGTQPSGQTCAVANGSGTISGADVTNVAVSCSTNVPTYYTVGGTITGLSSGTVILENNGGDDLARSADGSFTFATPLADCTSYSVTVAQQPGNDLLCSTVANAAGWISGANVTDVQVACSPYSFHSGYCVADPATDTLTGECMDLDTCGIGWASYYCSGPANLPLVQAYCGPVLDNTRCIY